MPYAQKNYREIIQTYKDDHAKQDKLDAFFQTMNSVRPKTHEIPEISFQNKANEKNAEILSNLKKKKTLYANRELEKLETDLQKLSTRLDIIQESSAELKPQYPHAEFAAKKLDAFLSADSYKSLVQKIESSKKLQQTLVQRRQKLIDLHTKNQQLEDKKEFFEFLKDEKQYDSIRQKITDLESKKDEDAFVAHQIHGKQTKLESVLEKQTKNVSLLNAMIRKVSKDDTSSQIDSIYNKFDLAKFRDMISEMRNDCEKYFDKQDLEQAMNGKKSVKLMAEEMHQNYSQVYARMGNIKNYTIGATESEDQN